MARIPEYFDYASIAQRAGIASAKLTAIESLVREDYPADVMMFELRMLRICRAIESGKATVQDALRRDDRSSAA